MFFKPAPKPETLDLPKPEQIAAMSYPECLLAVDNIMDHGIEAPQTGFLRLSWEATPRKDTASALLTRMEACISDDLNGQALLTASFRINEIIAYRKALNPSLDRETLQCAHSVVRYAQVSQYGKFL